jgi:hypothetical protein
MVLVCVKRGGTSRLEFSGFHGFPDLNAVFLVIQLVLMVQCLSVYYCAVSMETKMHN